MPNLTPQQQRTIAILLAIGAVIFFFFIGNRRPQTVTEFNEPSLAPEAQSTFSSVPASPALRPAARPQRALTDLGQGQPANGACCAGCATNTGCGCGTNDVLVSSQAAFANQLNQTTEDFSNQYLEQVLGAVPDFITVQVGALGSNDAPLF